jgi:hypothetical protein
MCSEEWFLALDEIYRKPIEKLHQKLATQQRKA